MKKLVTKEVDYCDSCNSEHSLYTCLTCKKEFCYSCSKTKAIEYPHSIHFRGSGDGFYCLECNSKHMAAGDNPLFNCFVQIKNLRNQYEVLSQDIKEAGKRAEEALKRLQR